MQCLYSRVASIISSVSSGDDGEISNESKARLNLVCECLKSDLGLQVCSFERKMTLTDLVNVSGISTIFLPIHFSSN